MYVARLSVSARFLVVLLIGFAFQAAISVVSLFDLRESLKQDRITEVKHLMDVGYSTVASYYERSRKGLMTDAQAREAAAEDLRSMHYDGNNYFFVWDINGKGIAHGAQPALEGKTFVENSPDAQNNPVVAFMVGRLLDVARSPQKEGLTTYRIPKRGQTVPLEKITYSRLFEPWGWSIGTGAYLDDIDDTFRARALSLLCVFLGMAALAGGLTFFIGRDLAGSIDRLSRRVTSVAKGELDGDVPDIDRQDEVGAMARALLVLRDTSREAAELRLDQLTGLATRKLLMDHLKRAKTLSARSGKMGGLLLIDLDKFKGLNDTHGHDFGDLLLQEIARRLTSNLREGDTVARLGGDEFVVVLPELAPNDQEAATALERVSKKLLAAIDQPHQLGRVTHVNTASIGMTLFRGDRETSEELLKQADLAMYRSKELGGNLCRFFDPAMETMMRARATLESDLRKALATGQFRLVFQPQFGAQGVGQLVGAEALLRWQHPERGLVMPGEFIPVAEETGLIVPIGRWVLETACKQLVAWQRKPQTAHLQIAVNVSARQFQHASFVEDVLAVLRDTAADPALLTLELTESLLVNNVEDVIQRMAAIKRQGVSFALDDFGTGYSSLSYLKRLPLDQLKIDRSFVRDVLADADDAAIARTIVVLGQTLGLKVLAEGIETAEQWEFLNQCGCNYYQGYYFSHPLTPELFEAFALRGAGVRALDVLSK